MPARFLNADLEIISNQSLQPLVDEIGNQAFLLHHGFSPDGQSSMVSYEIDQDPEAKSPETLTLAFCELIRGLSPVSRALWDSARERVVDLGYEVSSLQDRSEDRLSDDALRKMLDLRIHLVWTFYPAD